MAVSASSGAAVGVAVTTTTVSIAPLVGYVADALKMPKMTDPQTAAAVVVLGIAFYGVVHLVGPIAQAISRRLTAAVEPKPVNVSTAVVA